MPFTVHFKGHNELCEVMILVIDVSVVIRRMPTISVKLMKPVKSIDVDESLLLDDD
jgi:hypothetical protein